MKSANDIKAAIDKRESLAKQFGDVSSHANTANDAALAALKWVLDSRYY